MALKIKFRNFIIALLCILLGISAGCSGKRNPAPEKPQPQVSFEEKARQFVGKMTIGEKVGQLFIVVPEAFTAEKEPGKNPYAGLREGNAKYNVGGFILFGWHIENPSQLTKLIVELRQSSKYPPFIAVDEEGGRVARVANSEGFRVPKVGPIDKIRDGKQARETGATIGGYLRELGFNLDFAPCADVLLNPQSTVMATRTFGADPVRCGLLAGEYVKGMQSKGVIATLKHFPGHGGFESDSHLGLARSERTLEELRKAELVAFKKALAGGNVECVMVSHLSLPRVTKSDEPASLSKYMITDLLRGELGYRGLVITDSLVMGAIAEYYGAGKAAVGAVKAGADLILIPEDIGKAYDAVLRAVEKDEISKARLDESVEKIIAAKLKFGIIR